MRCWAVTCEPSTTGLSDARGTRRPPETVLTWTPYLQGLGLGPSRPSTTRGFLRRSKWMGTGSISGARIIVMTKRIWNVRVPYSRIRLVGIVGTPGRALRISPRACAQGHDTREIGTAARTWTGASPTHQRFHQVALQYVRTYRTVEFATLQQSSP